MPADTITQLLRSETGRFNDVINGRTFRYDPWISLIPRKAWPKGLGVSISNITYERQAPTDAEPTWTSIAESAGEEGGSCLPPVTKISRGSTERSFSLDWRAIEGPDFCATDMQFPFQMERQLDGITKHFKKYMGLEWNIKNKHAYFRGCNRKVVIDASRTETATMATSWPGSQATAILGQGDLDYYYSFLLRDAAGFEPMATMSGAPLMTLICSYETSNWILEQDANIRADLREAKPGDLLKSVGIGRVHKNFVHLHDPYPMRFSWNGSAYVEIAPFTATSTTNGSRYDLNSSWLTADYEASFIFHPEVLNMLIPEPVTKPHPDFRFDPVNYFGEFKLQNIQDRETNPDGTILYHRAIMAAAEEPNVPELGVAFIHKRCDFKRNLVTSCS